MSDQTPIERIKDYAPDYRAFFSDEVELPVLTQYILEDLDLTQLVHETDELPFEVCQNAVAEALAA